MSTRARYLVGHAVSRSTRSLKGQLPWYTTATLPLAVPVAGTEAWDLTTNKLATSDGTLWREDGVAVAPLPTVSSLNISTGPIGGSVVITGTSFLAGAVPRFNGTAALVYARNSSTQITAQVPPGATTGEVTVDNGNGLISSGGPTFTVGADLLDLDFTGLSIPSGADVSRTGDVMYGATSAGVLAETAVDTPLLEDRGDGVAGLWVFPAFDNLIGGAGPFDIGNGWSTLASPSRSNVSGPDGVHSAQRISDANGSGVSAYYKAVLSVGSNSVTAWWYKHASALAKLSYLGCIHTFAEPTRYWRLPNNTTEWKYVSSLETHGACNPIVAPTGYDQWALEGGADNAATGSVDVWGAQIVEGKHALPLVNDGTGAQALSVDSSELGSIVDDDGNFDLQIDLVSWFDNKFEPDIKPDSCIVFKAGGPDGEHSLRYDSTSGKFKLKLRGSDVAAADIILPHWKWGGALDFRVTFNATTGDWRVRARINGVVNNTRTLAESRPTELLGSITGGSPLGDFTSFHVCHDGAGGNFLPAMVRRVKAYAGADMARQVCQVMVIGDSLSASHPDSGSHSLAANYLTVAEVDAGKAIVDIAVPGATISDITSQYNLSEYKGDSNIEAIIVRIGTNDLTGLGHSGATVVADVQTLIGVLAAGNPGADIILVAPPRYGADADYDTYYNAISSASFAGCAIQSTAGADATSLDGVSMTPIWLWDAFVHWVNAGRYVAAAEDRASLVLLGVL